MAFGEIFLAGYLARSRSLSQRAIRFILPAHGASPTIIETCDQETSPQSFLYCLYLYLPEVVIFHFKSDQKMERTQNFVLYMALKTNLRVLTELC